MIYIAHRALFDGPDPLKENSIAQIELALETGFDCEIDVRFIDGKWFLGHDTPDYEVSEYFLKKNNINLWVHCKNLEALVELYYLDVNYFWHQEDDFALTSRGFIWSYPGKPIASHGGIFVLPERNPNWQAQELPECYGICSKYVKEIRSKQIIS